MAADLPSRKAAPVDYVRVCSGGAGHTGFIVPGSDNCLQISGRVRADYLIGNRYSRSDDSYGIVASSRLNLDYRQQTAIGTVRAYVRLNVSQTTGRSSFFYNGNGNLTGVRTTNNGNAPATIGQAYVQFGLGNGFVTAGRAPSFFDYYGLDHFWNFGAISGTQGTEANLLAYTANFGGGFTATLGIEDRGVNDLATDALPGRVRADGSIRPAAPNTQLLYQGRSYPDLVANLRLAQGWGTAQLGFALRNVAVSNYGGAQAGPLFPVAPALVTSSKTGFAVLGGATINLPAIGAGSAFVVEGVYTKGMMNYLGLGSSARVGYANVAVADFASGNVGTVARLGEGFSLLAALRAQWTPTLRQHVFVGYTSVSYGRLGNGALGAQALGTLPPGRLPGLDHVNSATGIDGLRSFSKFEIGTNFQYTLAPGLNLGVEVVYQNIDPKGSFVYANSKGVVATASSQSAVEGRFRVQRDF
jgi:hypothetical protein